VKSEEFAAATKKSSKVKGQSSKKIATFALNYESIESPNTPNFAKRQVLAVCAFCREWMPVVSHSLWGVLPAFVMGIRKCSLRYRLHRQFHHQLFPDQLFYVPDEAHAETVHRILGQSRHQFRNTHCIFQCDVTIRRSSADSSLVRHRHRHGGSVHHSAMGL
jgi:hypothetical protein